jgi:hypothetical protein
MPDDDLAQLQRLLARYAMAVDAKRWEGLERVFFPGSVIDFSPNGGIRATYPEIVDYLGQAMAIFAASQHYMLNFDFEVDGDTAGGRFYCFTQMVSIVDGADQLLADGGYYDVKFERRPEGWRISELISGLVWLDGQWPDGVPRPPWYGVSTDRF